MTPASSPAVASADVRERTGTMVEARSPDGAAGRPGPVPRSVRGSRTDPVARAGRARLRSRERPGWAGPRARGDAEGSPRDEVPGGGGDLRLKDRGVDPAPIRADPGPARRGRRRGSR